MKNNREITLKFKEKKHAVEKLGLVKGSWLENLEINGETVWKMKECVPYKLNYFDSPLPSDSNYRLDVLYLKGGDEKNAQDKMAMYEEIQKKDDKKREKHFNRYKS